MLLSDTNTHLTGSDHMIMWYKFSGEPDIPKHEVQTIRSVVRLSNERMPTNYIKVLSHIANSNRK